MKILLILSEFTLHRHFMKSIPSNSFLVLKDFTNIFRALIFFMIHLHLEMRFEDPDSRDRSRIHNCTLGKNIRGDIRLNIFIKLKDVVLNSKMV